MEMKGKKNEKRGDAVSCPQVPAGINTVYMYIKQKHSGF